jgi:hypothetical protein
MTGDKMKIKYECLTCLSKQTVELAVRSTNDPELQKKIIKYGLQEISDLAFVETPPLVTGNAYAYGKKLTGCEDPYSDEKKESNRLAQHFIDVMKLEEKVSNSKNPFDIALKLSIAGNIIDFSMDYIPDENDIIQSIEKSLETHIFGISSDELFDECKKANKIMIIADNAGEIVFDKILINYLEKNKITYVVKGGAIVNDATMKDAKETGLTEMVKVIDNGSAIQGTVLKTCSEEFIQEYNASDVIITKGQANLETLDEETGKNIFFLLRAKCKPIAIEIGCEQGEFVILKSQ